MAPLMNKARKPKFELHLSIYDLNNVPLVAGRSLIKWHLPNSIHGEHRGRTAKCSIDKINHRVSYNYSKILPLRVSIDRANNLTECPIEFEVLQEFPVIQGGRDDKITLGSVRLNLSEYVEESENFPRRSTPGVRANGSTLDKFPSHHRRPSSSSKAGPGSPGSALSNSSTTTSTHMEESSDVVDEEAEEGIVRRYLMQDSKINSTLKIGILMVQVDGERNFIAPPLKTAPMFGGIAGIIAGEQVESSSADHVGVASSGGGASSGTLPSNNINKSRDASELQDMYRHTLAASWACQPGELPADECIEDIFSGGDGWRGNNSGSNLGEGLGTAGRENPTQRQQSRGGSHAGTSPDSNSMSSDDAANSGTLRPSDMKRLSSRMRSYSGASDQSGSTVTGYNSQHPRRMSRNNSENSLPNFFNSSHDGITNSGRSTSRPRNHSRRASGGGGNGGAGTNKQLSSPFHHRDDSSGSLFVHGGEDRNTNQHTYHQHHHHPHHHHAERDRSGSLTSLAPTLGCVGDTTGDRGREGFRRPREVDEYEVRDDLVAWKLPGTVT